MIKTGRLAILLGAAAASLLLSQPRATGHDRPNILFIMADDVGVEAFGSYGGTSYRTPNLDALASSGLRFAHAYSQPSCTPSRVQLLTGQYNFRNYESFGYLDPDETTVAQVLQAAGYQTAIAGKWQLSNPIPDFVITDKPQSPNVTPDVIQDSYGFDEHSLWQLNQRGSRYWDPIIEQDGALLDLEPGSYGPDHFTEYLASFMERQVGAGEPFFAYYPMVLPHSPFFPTPATGTPASGSDRANFGANVEYIDTLVGRLIDKLEDLKIREETLVIFTSDNGTGRGITSQTVNGPVTGNKAVPTDAGTHVPLIVNWPGHTSGGVTDQLVDFTDFLPTLARVANAEANLTEMIVDGHSFLEQDGRLTSQGRDTIYSWYDSKGRNWPKAVYSRDTQYKLYDDGRFFDVTQTPLELPGDEIGQGRGSPAAEMARIKLQAVIDTMAVPEPSTAGLLFVLLACIAAAGRYR